MSEKKKCTPKPSPTEDGKGEPIECQKKPAAPSEDRTIFDPESTDVYVKAQAECERSCAVKPIRELFASCEKRYYKKSDYTTETCEQEFVDLLEAIDKCIVKNKHFLKLV